MIVVKRSESIYEIQRDGMTIAYFDNKEDAEKFVSRNKKDDISHPNYYTCHPSGVECIQVVEHMNFCLGNAIKYIWRAGLKDVDKERDLQKAIWYLNREIERSAKFRRILNADENK